MKRALLVLCAALAGGAWGGAWAGTVSQLPSTSNSSYDFSSEFRWFTPFWESGVADDWTCPDGEPIAAIRWWGSYWTPPSPGCYTVYSDGLDGAQPRGITRFTITVRENHGPISGMPFDHPGDVIFAWEAPINIANESPAFWITKSSDPLVMERVYEYYVDLSQTQRHPYAPPQLPQTMGTKYWLCIYAHFSDDPANINTQWGWHEAETHSGSYAVQTVEGNFDHWYIPCGGHDMAFELLPVPEPGSILALATGLAGLTGCAGRSRRRRGSLG